MRFIKLAAISAAVMASTAAMAAEPVAYQYQEDGGIVRNTTGAVVGGTKTFFQTVVNPAAISAEVGTLGYGANIGWAVNDTTELQAGWAGGDVSDLFGGDFNAKDVNYDVDSDFSNPYLGVQLRPAANWFTVGAGIIVPDNDLDVVANAKYSNYTINDVTYSTADVGALTGTLKHRNKLAPYATIGFRPNINDKWGVFGELGAAYLGQTDATVVSSNANNGDATIAATAQKAAADAKKELEDKDYLEWLPIVKLGATYRF